jgi:hypothetical protein
MNAYERTFKERVTDYIAVKPHTITLNIGASNDEKLGMAFSLAKQDEFAFGLPFIRCFRAYIKAMGGLTYANSVNETKLERLQAFWEKHHAK